MNYWRGQPLIAVAVSIIVATTALSSCRQSTVKTTQGQGASASEDNWQKSKECAAQAEETRTRKDGVFADYEKSVHELANSLSVAQQLGAIAASARSKKPVSATPITVNESSLNHYSPKFGKCFVRAAYTLTNVEAGSHLDRNTSILLVDAFEGGLYADLDFSSCYMGGKSADCVETERDIEDAMQN